MKIFVSAKFDQRERVLTTYEQVRAAGHEVVLDWTDQRNPQPYAEHQDYIAGLAVIDIQAICDCDVLIVLTSAEISGGCSTELGAAIARRLLLDRPLIYVVGEHVNKNIFYFHPVVKRVDTVEAALIDIEFAHQSHVI